MNHPTVSPFEAMQRLLKSGEESFTQDGMKYYLDGPPMCPKDAMHPCAVSDSSEFIAAGDFDEPITPETEWLN